MSPRPRTVSDEEILEAAARTVGRVGPARLTLAAVAEACGLSPSTLVQRFGSRRGLLVAMGAHLAARATAPFDAARAAHASPRAALLAALETMARGVTEAHDAFLHHFALLQQDLADPEMRAHAAAHARSVRAAIAALLREATAAGEVPSGDAEARARAVQAAFNGALLLWALEPEGDAAARVRADVLPALGG